MASVEQARPPGNHILGSLSAEQQRLVARDLETVHLAPDAVLCRAGDRIRHAYFPRQGVIALFATTDDGPEVGAGLVGATGMFGLALAVRRPTSTLSARSQGHGLGDRITATRFHALLGQIAPLRDAMLLYGHRLSMQMAQNTACMSLHSAERRLARWLVDVTGESGDNDRLSSTQSAMAVALGVQRPAVSRAASSLQQLGLIRYLRGDVHIVDRVGLIAVACTCSARGEARRTPK